MAKYTIYKNTIYFWQKILKTVKNEMRHVEVWKPQGQNISEIPPLQSVTI